MGLGDSTPRRCNRVCPDTRLLGVVSVTNPVSIHLKELDGWCVRLLKPVVHMEVGAEGCPLLAEVAGVRIGKVIPSDLCPRSAEITDEVTSFGGRQVAQEEGDCIGLYLREKKERKEGLVRWNRREASSAMVLRWPGW